MKVSFYKSAREIVSIEVQCKLLSELHDVIFELMYITFSYPELFRWSWYRNFRIGRFSILLL